MLLKALSEAVGVSGAEVAVRAIVRAAISDHVTDLRVNSLGGITALKSGTGAAPRPRVMIAAHMDEIGFIVKGFDSDGLIRVAAIGGVDDRIVRGLRVRVGDKQILGMFIAVPIHQSRDQTVVTLSTLRLDIGATSKEEASGHVALGDRVVFDAQYMELPGGMLRGKAFDDRVGCSLLIDLLQGDPLPVDLLVAFTVQEEVGLRGAQIAARILQPDVAIVLEGTTANDIPDPEADPDDDTIPNPTCRIGGGPVLTVLDSSMIAHRGLLRLLRTTADAEGIPYQLKTTPGGGTDGGIIHLSGTGVPTAVVSMPCRYIHSPAAYLHRSDYDHTLRLLRAALSQLDLTTIGANNP